MENLLSRIPILCLGDSPAQFQFDIRKHLKIKSENLKDLKRNSSLLSNTPLTYLFLFKRSRPPNDGESDLASSSALKPSAPVFKRVGNL